MCLIVEVVLQQDTCNSNDLNALQRRIFNIADPLFALFALVLPLSVRFASLELGWEVKKDKLGQKGKSAGNSGPGRFLSPCNGCGMRGEAERNSQKNILQQAWPAETYTRLPLAFHLKLLLF